MPNPAARPLGQRVREAPLWLWMALGLSVIHMAYDGLTRSTRSSTRTLVDFLFLEYLSLLMTWVFVRASRRPDLPLASRRGLFWTSLAIAGQAAGGLVLIGMLLAGILSFHGRALGNALLIGADGIFLLSIFLMVAALSRLPAARNTHRGPVRSVVDALIFIFGAGVPLWLFSLGPLLTTSSDADDIFTVVFTIISFAGLLILSWAVETRATLPSRRAVQFLLVGTGLLWLADIGFSIGKVSGFERGNLFDLNILFHSVAFVFWLVAGWCFCADPIDSGEMRPLMQFSPLPMITIVVEVGFFVLVVFFRGSEPQLLPKVLASLFLFLVILLARETFVIRDSLRLVAAEASHRSQARFEALVRHSSDVVIVVSDERTVRFASLAVEGVLGVAPEKIVGRDLLDFIHAEDRAEGAAFFDRLVIDSAGTGTIQWRFVAPDGTVHHLETAGSNLLKEPEIEGLVINSRDVSERTLLEEQLHRAARMEAVGRLAGTVAHDFNNLLAVVLTNAELAVAELKDRKVAPSDPVLEDIEEIRRASERGATLTNRLLAFSRSEIVKPKSVRTTDVLNDAFLMLGRSVGPAVNLVTEVDPACGSIKVNPDDFIQALINMANNARDAMPGGGTLTVSAAPRNVEERLSGSYLEVPPGRYVCVSMTDTGQGMDEATRTRAFEPFFTTKERSKGTGLGLASVYAMVKAAKGGITMNTAAGLGTTIQLWLPEAEHEPEEARPQKAPPAAISDATILVVEDEAPLRNAMGRILRAAGYRTSLAGSADEAQAIFDADPGSVDLVLTDIIMPGRSGTRLAADLKVRKPGQKFLLVSGFTGDQLEVGGLGDSGLRLLRKPYNTEQLIAAVRDVLKNGGV